ncbi:DNA-binding protein Alba [Candidatus Bathyarchaeota archaeon]|nr:DNA-binding protein Alba [Candidatus Bathyarchaeota archaeon]
MLIINKLRLSSLSNNGIKFEKNTSTDNVVLIGKKPVMNYVTACITFFNSGEKHVVIKARGRAICRAVDTVELLRRAFIKDLETESIKISTEELIRMEGQQSNVSTIEIIIAKAQKKQSKDET